MSLVFQSSGGGQVTLQEPSTASNYTLTLPAVTGTVLVPNNASALTLGTAQNSTSGTSINFTGIPSWAQRITILFNGVSGSGTSHVLVQIGSGSFQTTGYNSTGGYITTGANTISSTAGFIVWRDTAAMTLSGTMTIANISGNTWVESHSGKILTAQVVFGGGDGALSGVLDRVRITTVNGTDTFDAGSINIMWE